MGDTTQYVQFWFVTITVSNLVMIGLLVLVFALAVLFRRPGEQAVPIFEPQPVPAADGTGATHLDEQL